ncbi:ABC-2 type transport system permease protein [Gracilibacillus orientalis]|uniref:ABC-2 type transport system permease protein n=1 Tax=Gracilibacillus orientalis TaxID=334253 RepID=A0A1I4HR56_9BACI|nr:ABC transporter permease [Gracilibacillus orientalis]SFL44564.1 ABC-2 type transport system permease protein [Gracilibacillus orientalis]
MGSFIKKDLLLFLRDRKEIIITLALPILIIAVLNFAFAGLLDNDEETTLDLQLALVNQDDDENIAEQLEDKLVAEGSVDEAEAAMIAERASYSDPVQALFDFLESEDLQEWITVHELDEVTAAEKVEQGEIDGMLVIPNGFTVESLYAGFTGKAPNVSLAYKMEEETTNNGTLYDIIHGFIDNLNYQFAIQQIGGSNETEIVQPQGGVEQLGEGETFTLAQYFTLAMGILFALFLAITVAAKTGEEIRQKVFNRILVTNSHPMLFLIGKMVSTFILASLQMTVVFILAHFILDVFPGRSVDFWLGVGVIISLFSLGVAGLSAVFTSISLRMKDIDAANGVFSAVVMVLGVLGGNFVPIYVFPDWMQKLGEWTPNGLSLSVLMEWIQYEETSSLMMPSLMLIGFFILCLVIGLAMYPRRGEA